MAELRGRRRNGAALLPLVRAGVGFRDGIEVEQDGRPTTPNRAEVAA